MLRDLFLGFIHVHILFHAAEECNSCHTAMGYGFIQVVKEMDPPDNGINYNIPSKAEDVPK